MKTNFHTHTYRCLHAFGTEEDYIHAALKAGLTQLGFSDHAPFPDYDFGFRMQFTELMDYLSTIDLFKEKYSNIQLFKGLEIEYQPKYKDYYKQLFDVYKLDYLALGEHIYGNINNIFFAKSTDDYVDYANAICEAIQTGCFAFVAHPDLMFNNEFAWDSNCQKACELIINCAEKYDIVLEFNANGYRREKIHYPDGERYPYPDIRFWNMVKDRNIRVIIGSDCHIPEQVYDKSVEYALENAKKLGLNIINTIF